MFSDTLLCFFAPSFGLFLLLQVATDEALHVDCLVSVSCVDGFALQYGPDGSSVLRIMVPVALKVDVEVILLLVAEPVDVVEARWLQVAKVPHVVQPRFLSLVKK